MGEAIGGFARTHNLPAGADRIRLSAVSRNEAERVAARGRNEVRDTPAYAPLRVAANGNPPSLTVPLYEVRGVEVQEPDPAGLSAEKRE